MFHSLTLMLDTLPSHVQLTLLLLAGIGLYSASLVLYRLFLHPLAGFPGPKLAAATYWYDFYHDVIRGPTSGQMMYQIEHLHTIYGPVVRINPDEIAVKNPDWLDILYNNPRRDKWPRNHKANGSSGSMATTESRTLHRLRRAPVMPFFSKRSVNALEPGVVEKVEMLCAGVDGFMQRGEVLDVGVAFTALTLDVITEYSFSRSWNCLNDPHFSPEWKRAMTGLFEPVPIAKQFPQINQFMAKLPRWLVVKMAPDIGLFFKAKDAVQEQVQDIVSSHGLDKSDAYESKTIFHHIMEGELPDDEKTVARLTDEGFVVVAAGGETTARVLSALMFFLLSSPEWLVKVHDELDSVMYDPQILTTWQKLEGLPCLTACIKETLRLSSAVTNRLQLIDPIEATILGDWAVPPGTPMSTSIPFILLDPSIFESPQEWNPARWIHSSTNPASKVSRLEHYLTPFSKGPRACLGSNLAYAEMYLASAALLRRFDLALFDTERERDVDVCRDCFIGLPSKDARGVRVKVLGRRK